MGKKGTYPVRADTIIDLMNKKPISQVRLASEVGITPKALANILKRVSQPREETLVRIAAVLGVRAWRSLIEGYEGEPELKEEGGGVAVDTTTTTLFFTWKKGIPTEEALERVRRKLKSRHIELADKITIEIVRDEDENED